MEKLIMQALQSINDKLDNQGKILEQHGEILGNHGKILEQQGKILGNQGETLKEHGLILGALRTGQESLKAEVSELKLQNARDFGKLLEQIRDVEAT